LFHLTSYWFWSTTPDKSGQALHMELSDGPGNDHRQAFPVNFSRYHRALCVQSP
jgi:hypothetical protein